ncbi:Ribonuclease TUDOR 1 [Camellia lanceoleosa]|uniref:Ribonuclease TUDOR 1 n=1 Tax=Camellia lanceoleosa TaxID=1840588 RepID=A0ACC0FCP7_9ERIC|nr:Ribonuclease TUDOR 1 [Camellia lanceoleosa]
MGSTKTEIPLRRQLLCHPLLPLDWLRGGIDESFAWESREYLRKLCIGKDVTFRVDYTVPAIGRELPSFLGDKNVSLMVVAGGWAKVREQGQQKGEASPFLAELLRLEEQAKQQGLGRWSRGRPMEAIVEQVRDGSTLRVYLLPDFQFVQVFVVESSSDEPNGEASAEPNAPLTSAQRLAASSASSTEVSPDPFGREAKHFTEIRVLNRDVRIVLEGVDKFSNLIGSVYYPDGESAKDLALELIENIGVSFIVMLHCILSTHFHSTNYPYPHLHHTVLRHIVPKVKYWFQNFKQKDPLRIWTNYIPPATNSKAIHDQNFTGKVVEVVSGDCIIVADDSVPYGSPLAERRVNLSSIRCPKMGNLREMKTCSMPVNVQMEYSRKVIPPDAAAAAGGPTDSRVMDFGSVFLPSPVRVKVMMFKCCRAVGFRGYGTVIRHRDFEERSNYYDALLSAESRAIAGKKGIHSTKDSAPTHIADLTTGSAKKTKDFLPFLQRKSGHRFKLFVPKETCSIMFSFSGVRCPAREEPFSDEAIALMRRKIMQRDVEIEVETVDRTGTFLGSLWESKTNTAVTLLEAGLAKLQMSFGTDRIPDAHLLMQAEQSAKRQKLKIWENFVEGEEVSNGAVAERKHKEELKVTVTEVLGGGKFYVQVVGDQKVSSIQQQLASLSIQEAPVIGAFNPKKGDIVLAKFSADDSWNRAMCSVMQPCFTKIPSLEEDYGQEAAVHLSEYTLNGPKEFKVRIEERDTSGGKVKGQGTGTVLMVNLIDTETNSSINAALLKDGLARLEKRKRWEPKEKQAALDELEKFQEEAKSKRLGMWEYGDIQSDDEDTGPPVRKAAGKR